MFALERDFNFRSLILIKVVTVSPTSFLVCVTMDVKGRTE